MRKYYVVSVLNNYIRICDKQTNLQSALKLAVLRKSQGYKVTIERG